MSRRLGAHRQRPARSEANRARVEITRLKAELAAAYRAGNQERAANLEFQLARVTVASLCR